MRSSTGQSQAGLTLLEIVLVTALLAVVGMIVLRSLSRMQGFQAANDFDARLQAQSYRAMRVIASDLRHALYRPAAGAELPYVFDDGVAESPYAAHAHPPAQSEAQMGDPDFGPNREIVFVLPEDGDGDGRPDINLGAVVWSTDEVSYTVITDASGNALMRSVNGADPTLVARHVERVVFDTPESSGFTIPLGSVRVRLFFRVRDRNNTLYRYQNETVLRLQPASM